MSSIEIMAVVFAGLTLVKMVAVLVNPRAWIKLTAPLYKHNVVTTVVYLVLAAVTGYYLLQHITVVELGSAILFTVFLVAVGLLPYTDSLRKMREEFLAKGVKHAWLSIVIWTFFAVWVLYNVFA